MQTHENVRSETFEGDEGRKRKEEEGGAETENDEKGNGEKEGGVEIEGELGGIVGVVD